MIREFECFFFFFPIKNEGFTGKEKVGQYFWNVEREMDEMEEWNWGR